MGEKRQSIEPTYDSAETGPRYHVTTRVDGRTVAFQKPIDDPFAYTTVRVAWRDVLRAAFRRHRLTVEVVVGGDPQIVNDVLELDAQTLIGNSTRRDEFDLTLNASLIAFAALPMDDE